MVWVVENVDDFGVVVLQAQLHDVRQVAAHVAGGLVPLVHVLVCLEDVDDAVRREEGLGIET